MKEKNALKLIINGSAWGKLFKVLKKTTNIVWLFILLMAVFNMPSQFITTTNVLVYAHIVGGLILYIVIRKAVLSSNIIKPGKESRFKRLSLYGACCIILSDLTMLYSIYLINNNHVVIAIIICVVLMGTYITIFFTQIASFLKIVADIFDYDKIAELHPDLNL